MGAWGPGIFSDDSACDVRSDDKGHLASGLSDEDVLARIRADYADDFDDADDGPTLRIALALILHKVGRLPDDVRDEALAAIDAGPDERWDTPKLIKARAKALDSARKVLASPQLPRKKISRPWAERTSLEAGMVLGYKTERGFTLLRVARLDSFEGGSSALVRALAWEKAGLPSGRRLHRLKDQRINTVTMFRGRWRRPATVDVGHLLCRAHKSGADYDAAGFTVIARVPPRRGDADVPLLSGILGTDAAESIDSGEWFHTTNAKWNL